MLRHIQSELYRITHKKSFYIFLAGAIGLFSFIFMMGTNEAGRPTHDVMVMMASMLLPMSVAIFGTNIFYHVFADDLSHKSLPLIFSTGLSRLQYVLSKFIVFILVSLGVYAILGLYFIGIWQIGVGSLPALNSDYAIIIKNIALACFISLIGFGSLAATFSYFLQNGNVGGILMPIMTIGLTFQIAKLLLLVFSWFEKPMQFMLSYQFNEHMTLLQNPTAQIKPELGWVVFAYIVFSIIASTASLSLKDIN